MKIFKRKELLQPTFFQRLFKKHPEENVIIEINNILAENESNVLNINLDQIVEIAEKYNVNLPDKNHLLRLGLFEDYLKHCLADKKIEDQEIKELEHLKNLLFLSDDDLSNVICRETEKIYAKSVKKLVKDGEIDNTERENLEKLKSDLLIPDDMANEIFQENAKDIYQKFIDGAIEDYSLSPDEEAHLDRIGKNLGIDSQYSDNKKQTLEKYKIYWQIENAELPVLTTDINLQKSELLHFKAESNWLEQRRITKRINYGGPTARIKIMKGVYYRAGSIGVQRVSEDVWQTVDSGTIYLTSKRLIFMGYKGNKTIPVSKILDLKPYNNGVEIQKDSGKSPFLEFDKNVDIFSMMLARLMKN